MKRLTTRLMLALVLLLMLLTWGGRTWQIARVERNIQTYQDRAAEQVLGEIDREFEDLQASMLEEARVLAEDPVIRRRLEDLLQGATQGASLEALFRRLAEHPLPERGAVELYDPTPRRLAWKGYGMPLDTAPDTRDFLRTYQVEVVRDGNIREALVVWWPIRRGARVLGVVRVLRLIQYSMPVENAYLRSYSLSDTWTRAARRPVEVVLEGERADPPAQANARSRPLLGADGRILGRVFVPPLPPERLVEAVEYRFDNLMALWASLLFCGFMAGLWGWYRALYRPPPTGERGRLVALVGRFCVVAGAWWGLRYALLALDVPARWQRGKAPLAALFDATHFASTLGGGLLKSMGDLFATSFFALLFVTAFLALVARLLRELDVRSPSPSLRGAPVVFFGAGLLASTAILLLTVVLAVVARHAVLDSTLDYFARSGLLPDVLVLFVFCALLLAMITGTMLAIGLAWGVLRFMMRAWPADWPGWTFGLSLFTVMAAPVLVGLLALELDELVSWATAGSVLAIAFGLASLLITRGGRPLDLLNVRSVLLGAVLLTIPLYAMLYKGMEAQQRAQMMEAIESFDPGYDPAIEYAINQVLDRASANETVLKVLAQARPTRRRPLDAVAGELVTDSPLLSFPSYDVTLSLYDTTANLVGGYNEDELQGLRTSAAETSEEEFEVLREIYRLGGNTGNLVDLVTSRRQQGRFQYSGITPIRIETATDSALVIGWVMIQAELGSNRLELATPFPRVLLPGRMSGISSNMSLAEFQDGVLIRSTGEHFGRYRMDEEVHDRLLRSAEVWHAEEIQGRPYLTYYRRQYAQAPFGVGSVTLVPVRPSVNAVRVPVLNLFDHLYYLLRLTVAGLLIGVPLYGVVRYVRRHVGQSEGGPARYRDKVLNAFLGVGVLTVAVVGYIGLRVLEVENEKAVQSWLRQHLERVEETLSLNARDGEAAYHVLSRVRIDSLAAQVGLDLNVYEGERLVATNRPQLVRDRLIDQRLPAAVYQALHYDRYRVIFNNERFGSFTYTAGYRALLDEAGRPQFVLSVPTLPEQERIEEERARTVAYLFGALLLLVVAVLLTAALMANALTRPIGRLREGLEAIALGRFERALPVETHDEIGELVRTFNATQDQLAESRRQLARQERQLAWQEMARQVAHEIKNPLTPMKLSVQHLRRAFDGLRFDPDAPDAREIERFRGLFDRITTTLIEQVDTLARIANEFSSFARLPKQIIERLDLNTVVREAVSLMQEQGDAEVRLNLSAEPLVLEADREELRRIFINLIKNAIEATPEDGARRVEVATRMDPERNGEGGWAYSTVTDAGVGVPAAMRDRIFQPNFSTKNSGTGLGLAIVKKSIEDLKGEIGFETEEGRGTTFWLRLPLVED